MPRAPRVNLGGIAYHVLNRANGRLALFEGDDDYRLFLDILAEAHQHVAMRMMGYCIMPNHWHLVLWPHEDGDLSEFVRWLTVTHTQRWHARHGTIGAGHVYQGRYKSFPVQRTRPSAQQRAMGVLEGGDATLAVLRYVERNPVRAGLVTRADAWPWGSAAGRQAKEPPVPLVDPPVGLPPAWMEWVNRPQSEKELAALQRCIARGAPFGREQWVKRIAAEWGLDSTLRPRGRPRKTQKGT